MHKEILSKEQLVLLPFIKLFSKDFYLVGGTALALYIGHRRSIDFDLFTDKLRIKAIINLFEKKQLSKEILYKAPEQIHFIVNYVKLTFFEFPYNIPHKKYFEDIIRLPSLLDLAAMKAFALGGRAKWKDYFDLYMIFRYHFSLAQVSQRAKVLFADMFNEKLFRQQLCFFKDIDYAEDIDFISATVHEKEIKAYLTEIALTPF